MDVLERDGQLAALADGLTDARGGRGGLVWVQGEAGIGKTTLVDRFCAGVRGARVVAGSCDPLETPRPLGPALEIVERLGALGHRREPPSRDAVFRVFLDELSSRSWVTVAVIEDAHWADEATLDLLRVVGRRLRELRALLVVTLRDDELDPGHPVRTVLGDLATAPGVARIELPALTRDAVAELVDADGTSAGVDVDALHALTGGNPFFVTEVLAAGRSADVPASVRDAVLGRAARLSESARGALEAAAITPHRAETWLVGALASTDDSALDDAVTAGMLRPGPAATVMFRHELARIAVEGSVPPARRRTLHARAARLLLERDGDGVDPARIAHHAEQAGDVALTRDHAVRAARRAVALGAHREAFRQYARAVRHADGVGEQERAGLLVDYACQCGVIDRPATALDAAAEAVALLRRSGEPRALGRALRIQDYVLWNSGDGHRAAGVRDEAIALLEEGGPSDELAGAYFAAAQAAWLARDLSGAEAWGSKAIDVAEACGSLRALALTLNVVGPCRIVHQVAGGDEDVRRGIAIASDERMADVVMLGWSNLGVAATEVRDLDTAASALETAIAVADEEGLHLDHFKGFASVWLARVRLDQGDWPGAAALLDGLHPDDPASSPPNRITTLTTAARLSVRRGRDGAVAMLDRASQLASGFRELSFVWPIAAARAEAAWLAGDVATVEAVTADAHALAREHGHAWALGELTLWRDRAGVSATPPPDTIAEPYALHLAGRFREAAAAWESLGCPYEAADALADSDDPDDLLRALATLDHLVAVPAAARVRHRLRTLGVRGVPRGPRDATAANPAGLTPRQAEVLELLGKGMSDADIAGHLHLSPKTVGHHVSAILAKLGAVSRGEAVHLAHRRQLLDGAITEE